ncbi:MAG: FAD-dependent oxidoreductase [Candidatus Thiodiazotropha sp.]
MREILGLGDQALRQGWKVEPGRDTGKRVMVVGAGPAGLACAYHLCRFGHQVTVYEASPQAGGMVRYGIPKYRMPREKLEAEIQRIEAMGVRIVLNTRIDDIQGFMQANDFDAVFLAIGAQQAKRIEIPADDSVPVLDAVSLLRSVEEEEHVALRGRVAVYGGGNTAVDVARTAIRMGATRVTRWSSRHVTRCRPMRWRFGRPWKRGWRSCPCGRSGRSGTAACSWN